MGTDLTDQSKQNEVPPATAPAKRRGLTCRLGNLARWLCTALVLAVLLLISPLGAGYGNSLIHVDPLVKADYIVMLGGGLERDVEAARLYQEGWAPKIIISIGGRDVDNSEEVLKSFGVPPGDIIVDEQPRRTADHPRTVAALPGVNPASQRFLIVTSPYHTSRSQAVFLKAGYKNIVMRSPRWRAGGDVCRPGNDVWGRLKELPEKTYEMLAWGLYKLHGWV